MKALQTFITSPWLQFDVLLLIREGKQMLSLSCEVLPYMPYLKQNGIFLITSVNVWWSSFILVESSKYLALSPSSYIQIIVLFPFHLFLIVSFYHCVSHLSFPGLHPYLSASNRPQPQTEHVRTNFSAAVLCTCFSVRAKQCPCFTVTNSMISICGMPLLASQEFFD